MVNDSAPAQVLSAEAVARLLVTVHGHLQRARCGRHRAASLGPLKALLALLGPHVASPLALRYASHVLLLCLRVRCCMSSQCSRA